MLQYKRKILKKRINSDFIVQEFDKEEVSQKKTDQVPFQILNLGIYLITPLLLGVIVGLYFDNRYLTERRGVIFGLLVGSVGTFFNLIKLTKQQ